MKNELAPNSEFEAEVAGRFGILPNFFRSAQAAPELIQQLWGFARRAWACDRQPARQAARSVTLGSERRSQ